MLSFQMSQRNQDHDTLFFVHIPKTAGTSVRKMLYELYPSRVIFPNMATIRKREEIYCNYSLFHQQLKQQDAGIELLMGHLPFHQMERFPELKYFTFLRDPIQRALSNLKHFQRHKERFKGQSLLEIYQHADIKIGQVDNIQVKYFAPGPFDQTVTGWKNVMVDRDRLDTAKENLKQCALVGITEQFDQSIELAKIIFGWAPKSYKRFNTAPSDQSAKVNPRLLDLLEENNQYDIEFYRFGLKLLEQLRNEHGL